jgi:hypothetical protein
MRKILPVVLLLVFGLTGCLTVVSSESNLELSGNEHWRFKTTLTVPEFEVLTYSSAISEQFNNQVAIAENIGVNLKWKLIEGESDGYVNYIIDARGNGFDLWNTWINMPDSLKLLEDAEEPVIDFSLDLFSSGLNFGLTNTFVLSGGKVLDSNGTTMNSNSVKWVNPVTMYARMEYPTFTIPLWVLITGGAVLLLVVLILIILAAQKNKPRYSRANQPMNYQRNYPQNKNGMHSYQRGVTQNRPGVRYCSKCGKPLSEAAKHCIYCGKSKPF